MRLALDSLAVAAPDWLAANIQPDWFDRYGRRVENYRLPKLDSEREELASIIGADGLSLLDAIYDPTVPQWLRQIPPVETLRQIWVQQFYAPEPDVLCVLTALAVAISLGINTQISRCKI